MIIEREPLMPHCRAAIAAAFDRQSKGLGGRLSGCPCDTLMQLSIDDTVLTTGAAA